MWTVLAELDFDDPADLEAARVSLQAFLQAEFGPARPHTWTVQSGVAAAIREQPPERPLGARPGFVAEHEHRGLKRRYGK